MLIAHLSDFHISRHGSRLTQLKELTRRATRGNGWETISEEDGWTIQLKAAEGRRFQLKDRLRLVDDTGAVHLVLKTSRSSRKRQKVMGELRAHMEIRNRTTPAALSHRFPSESELGKLLRADPDNLNLRFCKLAYRLREAPPDHIVITGDLTDDAEGFELVLEGLAPWFEHGRVSCVPGNHDLYPSPPVWVPKHKRKTEAEKRRAWADFCAQAGLPAQGSYPRTLGKDVSLLCLDSCHRPPIPGSASGLVRQRELKALLRDATGELVMACLHHHVVNPPVKAVGPAPLQAGMRLRNAKRVYQTLRDSRVQVVMNGHRHLGYRFHPAHSPLILSAPSSTIGCRSGGPSFYWQLQVVQGTVQRVQEIAVALD